MARHKDKGTIKIGNVTVQEPGKGFTAVQNTGSNNKKTKKDDSDTKKGKQTFRSKFVYGGSEGVDEDVDKKDKKYNVEGEHKLSSQFRYLADKYYGGKSLTGFLNSYLTRSTTYYYCAFIFVPCH